MDIFLFLRNFELWQIPIMLALIGLGFAKPFQLGIRIFRAPTTNRLTYLAGGFLDEIIFRVLFLSYALTLFEPLIAILAVTLIYMLYAGFLYGPSFTADALVIGFLFGFAILELGPIIVIAAGLIYRIINVVWMGWF